MNLRRLARADVAAWRAPVALAAVLVAVQWFGEAGALRYDRAGILRDGELFRLVTGHLVHHDVAHFGWNLAGLALVAWLFAREYTPRQWLAVSIASTVAIDVGFLWLEPQLEWYVGFSGVLHGLTAAGLVAWWRTQRDSVTVIVTAIFAAKLAWEHLHGALPFTAATLDIPVVHSAHTYGAVGGAVAAAWLGRRRRVVAPSL